MPAPLPGAGPAMATKLGGPWPPPKAMGGVQPPAPPKAATTPRGDGVVERTAAPLPTACTQGPPCATAWPGTAWPGTAWAEPESAVVAFQPLGGVLPTGGVRAPAPPVLGSVSAILSLGSAEGARSRAGARPPREAPPEKFGGETCKTERRDSEGTATPIGGAADIAWEELRDSGLKPRGVPEACSVSTEASLANDPRCCGIPTLAAAAAAAPLPPPS